MNTCNECGHVLKADTEHVCQSNEAAASKETIIASAAIPTPQPRIDVKMIVKLMKNPQESLKLHHEKDFVYGLIGIGASILGFCLWALVVHQEIKKSIKSIFGMFESLLGYALARQLLVASIFALVILLAALWLIGTWKGQKKRSLKEVVTYLGAMQTVFGACFIIAAVVALISLNFSYLLIGMIAMWTIIFTFMAATDLFDIKQDDRFMSILLSSAIFCVAIAIVLRLS